MKESLRGKGRARAAVDYYRSPLADGDAAAFSVKLPMPALVIYGQDEPDVRKAIFRKAGAAFSGPVTCGEYPRVGHWPHLEAPDRFERDVVAFLKSHGIA